MARQSIDTSPTGDTLKQGFDKTDANFAELYSGLAEPILWEEIEGKPEEYPPAPHSHTATGGFHAYATTEQSNLVNNALTKVLFPAEECDVNGWFAESRYTPQIAGYYSFSSTVNIYPCVADKIAVLALYKNGARYKDIAMLHPASSSPLTLSGSVDMVHANGSTDYFEVYVYHNFGTTLPSTSGLQRNVYFTGKLAGVA